MPEYILSIDQSTAGTKGLVWNTAGGLLARADIPHRQIIDECGYVEHDPEEIFRNVIAAAKAVIEKARVAPGDIKVAGISNQRETAVCWSRSSGRPLCNAVVWQCARAADVAQHLRDTGLGEEALARTGLQVSPYFAAPKWSWMIRHIPVVARVLEKGDACFGTIDSWLLYNLTDGQSFKTDCSNASRTMLLNLDTLRWDDLLMEALGIPLEALPELCHSDALFGHSDFAGVLPTPIPIHAMLGDSHAALFANGCVAPGSIKVTYGTGSSVMMNTGSTRPVNLQAGIVTSLAWGMDGEVRYVLEGNINYAGAVVKWLVEDLGLLDEASRAGEVAESVPGSNGVYLVPAFSGLGAPYFAEKARAAIVGMKRGTRSEHIVRAAEECIAYQVMDIVRGLIGITGSRPGELRVDGGVTKDKFLMQFQSDILGIPLSLASFEELSGAGAAYCAALAVGIGTREAFFSQPGRRYVYPAMGREDADRYYAGWQKSVKAIANLAI